MAMEEPQQGYITLVWNWLGNNNETEGFDFTQPYIKRSLRYVYPLFMFLHAVVGLIGLVGNVSMIVVMGRRRLYRDQTFVFLGNLALSDIIKCVFVLPISLANMLLKNWVFGSFMCFFLPMIQLFPIHASMLTFLMIAVDRYRLIVNPFKTRVPAGLCIIAVWVGAVCVVLPHAVYIKYIDLGALFGDKFDGVGICYINMKVHTAEKYLRAMFVTLYVLPLAIIGFLYVKISAELKARETAPIVVRYSISGAASQNARAVTQSDDSTTTAAKVTLHNGGGSSSERGERGERGGGGSSGSGRNRERGRSGGGGAEAASSRHKDYSERSTREDSDDDELDLVKEKRAQNYLIAMVTFFAMCWCPMNILILVHYFVHENVDNSGHIDITFITFAWFGFLSTCSNPLLFASWRMPSSTKDRLKGYFRFSNRRRSSSQVSRTEVTETFVVPATPSPREPRKAAHTKVKSSSERTRNGLSPYNVAAV